MVWLDYTHTLLTILGVTLWLCRTAADLPLYTSDIPESERGETIKHLEKTLLNILGMKEKPTPSKEDARISQFMLDLYNQQMEDSDYMAYTFSDGEAHHANTARSFSSIGTKTHSQSKNIANLFFNITDIASHEELLLARLHLFPHNSNSTQKYKVEVYELISSPHSVEKSITRLIDTKIITPSKDSAYHTLDVTPALQRWHSQNTVSTTPTNKNKLTGVQVHIKSHDGQLTNTNHLRLRRDTTQQNSEWKDTMPEMVIFTHDRTLSRTKRGSGKKRNRGSKKEKTECQRQEMNVNFTEVGWQGWILAPHAYDAYFCHGACDFPLPDHLNASNHAIIQTLVNEIDPGNAPQACCIPTELSPMAMLYYYSSSPTDVKLKMYPDMIVEACGCR